MTRYYLAATLVVVLVGSIVVAHRLAAPDLRIRAGGGGTPTVESSAPPEPERLPPAFTGEGTWVLSALPACFEERSRIRGPLAAVRPKLPPEDARILPPATIRSGDCTLYVRPHDLWVFRGPDRMRVPPEAALYRENGRLTLVVRGPSEVEIRRYRAISEPPRSGTAATRPSPS